MSEFTTLIPVVSTTLDGTDVQTVNARDLHAFLEITTEFRNWIARRIEEYGFSEGQDFRSFLTESNGGRPAKEYSITLDMAKELAMVERNEKGKQARVYFIECERRARYSMPSVVDARTQALIETLVRLDQVEQVAKRAEEAALAAQQQQSEQIERLRYVEAKQQSIEEGFQFFTVLAFSKLHDLNVPLNLAQEIGRKAKRLSDERGYPIDRVRDPRFGMVNAYHADILKDIIAEIL